MERLSLNTLATLPEQVHKPEYDLSKTTAGIVHLGPGAFHRAHQAVYTDSALKYGGNWRITGVSMRTGDLKEKLKAQDNLYSLMVLDKQPYARIVGALASVLVLADDRDAVMDALCAEQTYIVSITVTEKGYCLFPDGTLNIEHKDIVHDLEHRDKPISVVGLLVSALQTRFVEGRAQLTIISCDNLPDNGSKLKAAVQTFAQQVNRELALWIEQNIAFPNTMVDSITPATDDALLDMSSDFTGVKDAWPIQREAFTQWVIEDKFSGPRPAWDKVGVTFTDSVSQFERAKLRVLNGTHSTLAYIGSLLGFETVYQAISNSTVQSFIEQLLDEEILPSIKDDVTFSLPDYAKAIVQRYHNPEIKHYLSQIACDGSKKIPIRILAPIRENIACNRPFSRLCMTVAAWLEFIYQQRQHGQLTDPKSEDLLAKARAAASLTSFISDLVADSEYFDELAANRLFTDTVLKQSEVLQKRQSEGAELCLTNR